MWKEELIPVYENTIELCKDITPPNSVKFYEPQRIRSHKKGSGNIIVESLDTVSALVKYAPLGKTAILNMASSKRKGGGVLKGAVAQEECLFRCSNLFHIQDSFYPIQSNEFIYTFGATFIKDFHYNVMTPVQADVITMAAINLNKTHIDNIGTKDEVEDYDKLLEYKIGCMLNSAVVAECDNLILGAWGCGVFKNDPSVVAKMFKRALDFGYVAGATKGCFENVVFAIINDHNSVKNNYQIFKDILEK